MATMFNTARKWEKNRQKEDEAVKHLRELRLNGHTYLELRGNGALCQYFCLLCQAGFQGKLSLTYHLNGDHHTEMQHFAKFTMLRRNPWPFNDGCSFFDTRYGFLDVISGDASLTVRKIGNGVIGARTSEMGQDCSKTISMWCQWFGNVDKGAEQVEYALVIFSEKNNDFGGDKEGSWCNICSRRMLAGKDVATLLNLKNGRLSCFAENENGIIHKFHVSCLIHWVLFSQCNFGITTSMNDRAGKRRKLSIAKKQNGDPICPNENCQSSGFKRNQGDPKPFSAREMRMIREELLKAHQQWIGSPEDLSNCSTGLCFISPEEQVHLNHQIVKEWKRLRFYRAT